MAKRFLEDMVKVKRSAITPKPFKERILEHTEEEPIIIKRVPRLEKASNGPRYGLWVIAFISGVFLLFAFSFFFANATVTINPKVKEYSLNENLAAFKDSSTDDLSFDLVIISGDESKVIPASAEKQVALPAKGTVVIYNNFSGASQALDIDTRLEGSNGKMYKTEKRIVVPGKVGATPGSVEVNIYASAAGEEYNSGPLDFKIFGFKPCSRSRIS